MTLDAFRCLRAMGDHVELFDLGTAQAEAVKVAAALLSGAIAGADKGRLRAIGQSIGGEAFDELAKKVKPATVSAAIDRIDGPATPKRTAPIALKRLKEIAGGIEPLPPPVEKMTLVDLRRAHGPDLGASLDRQRSKAKAALGKLDRHFPGLAKVKPDAAIARLVQLAEGAEPIPEIKLDGLDAAGLKQAHADLGAFFEPWLDTQKKPNLKAAVERIDPERAKGRKLAASEHPSILREIAGGGALLRADDDVDPMGQVRFPKQDG